VFIPWPVSSRRNSVSLSGCRPAEPVFARLQFQSGRGAGTTRRPGLFWFPSPLWGRGVRGEGRSVFEPQPLTPGPSPPRGEGRRPTGFGFLILNSLQGREGRGGGVLQGRMGREVQKMMRSVFIVTNPPSPPGPLSPGGGEGRKSRRHLRKLRGNIRRGRFSGENVGSVDPPGVTTGHEAPDDQTPGSSECCAKGRCFMLRARARRARRHAKQAKSCEKTGGGFCKGAWCES
jgi:hypothetical protein